MNKKEAISQLESFISDCKEFVSVEPTENDVQALEVAIAALKETAPEVPVQEQLIEINRKVKSIYRCITIYSVTIMIMLNLVFYRFNNRFQGLTDIIRGSTNISRNISVILQNILEVINRI